MLKRKSQAALIRLSQEFKAVAVTGPRQSGKTTIVRSTFPEKPYVNLENPDTRNFANEDPRGFLAQYPSGAILDEAQRTPELFSYLQQILDETTENGSFILTGSSNFLLQESINQSLAGRIAYINQLPFSYSEIKEISTESVDEILFKGLYPPVWDKKVGINSWYSNYLKTYVERDVRLIKNITNLYAFDRFLRLCAGRVGQLLNLSNLSIEVGVDSKTIGSWVSVLEESFIAFRLTPHYQNFNKRVVKMPKLYFYDTGLVCALLGIQNAEQLQTHPIKGALFESFVVTEFLKKRYNEAKTNNLFFWRSNKGHEVDLIIDRGLELFPVEIKAGETIQSAMFQNLNYYQEISGVKNGALVYAGHTRQARSNGIAVLPFTEIDNFENALM